MLKANHPPLVIVAAMSKDRRAIGNKNKLLWHNPTDLKRFKELTLGHPIIMGRTTFESILTILGRPLPHRTNIVLTRDTAYEPIDATVAHSLDDAIAIAKAEHPTEIHIGGGAALYEQALPLVDRLHITWYEDEPEADTFFPAFENDFRVQKIYPTAHHKDLTFQWIDYIRKV